MSRIRTLKPEILDDDATSSLSNDAFRVFVGGIVLADDQGRLRAGTRLVWSRVFFNTQSKTTERDCEIAILEIAQNNLISLYEVRGQRYLEYRRWSKHQRIDNAGRERLPGPDDPDAKPVDVEAELTTLRSLPRENERRTATYSKRSAANRRGPSVLHSESAALPPTSDLRPPTSDLRPPTSDQGPPTTESRVSAADPSVVPPESPVEIIVERYRSHHPKARPNDRIKRKIRDRLRDGFSVEDLCRAIDGCHVSPWHCGENPDGTKFQSLDLIVRDPEHVQSFIEKQEAYERGELRSPNAGPLTAVEASLQRIVNAVAPNASVFAPSLDDDDGEVLASGSLRLADHTREYRGRAS